MQFLKDIDAYILPPGQSLARSIYQNLDDKYYPNTENEVIKAQQWFSSGSYKEIREQLEMFSTQPIDDHAATIISKIQYYLQRKAEERYEEIQRKMCDDQCLTIEETRMISKMSFELMKIDVHLS